jgi:putative flippase GtrA
MATESLSSRACRFVRYAAVGATGTAIQYAILGSLVPMRLCGPVLGSSIGAVAGAIVNYLLNRRLTFRSSARHSATAPRFFTVAAGGFAVNWAAMSAMTRALHAPYLAAQCAATAAVLALTFTANSAWSFRART